MQPDYLAPTVNVELVIVSTVAIYLVDSPDVRMFLPKRVEKTRIKICCQHGSDQAAHDKFRENLVAMADAIHWPHHVKNDALPKFSGN